MSGEPPALVVAIEVGEPELADRLAALLSDVPGLRLAAAFMCLTRPSAQTMRYSVSKLRVPAAASRISSSTLARSSAWR